MAGTRVIFALVTTYCISICQT